MTLASATEAPSRQFWVFWAAATTSEVGSAVTKVALPLTAIVVLGATELQMGLLAAAGYVAWLVIGLPAGPIVRALPLRRVQVGMDLVRGLAIVSIPLAWLLGALTLTQLLVVALAISFADVLFFVANSTFLPRVVAKEQLQARNSLMSGTHAVCQLGGPSIGGVLVQFLGAVPTLVVDAVSYLTSGLLLRSLPESTQLQDTRRISMRAQIREGWHFVIEHPIMRPCLWVATAANFVTGAHLALFAVYLVRDLEAPAGLVGVLLAADGVGSLLGAALTPRIVRRIGSARACLAGTIVAVVGAFVLPLGAGAAAYVLFGLGSVILGSRVVVITTTTRTYRQIATPAELLSRVMATVRFVSWGAIPVGSVLAGALGGWIGARYSLFVFAGLTVLCPLALVLSPVRRIRDFPETA